MIGGEDGLLPNEEESKVVGEGVMAGRLGEEPGKTLQEARFVIGDFVDCAVLGPGVDGGLAPALGGRGGGFGGRGGGGGGGEFARGRGFGGGWENGGGFRGRGGGGMRGGSFGGGRLGDGGVPAGEWRRGERVPEGRGGYGRGRGRGH